MNHFLALSLLSVPSLIIHHSQAQSNLRAAAGRLILTVWIVRRIACVIMEHGDCVPVGHREPPLHFYVPPRIAVRQHRLFLGGSSIYSTSTILRRTRT